MNDDIKAIKYSIMSLCQYARKHHKVTQKRLSELTGVSDSAFSLFENGRFSFEIAWLYYSQIMNDHEQWIFRNRVDDLKNKYLEV